MNKIFFVVILSFIVNSIYSQNYDLIVTTEGDSIACKIDSISDSSIYFQMKINSNWIHTTANKSGYSSYQLNVIDKRKTRFVPGSSYLRKRSDYYGEKLSMRDLKNNSVFTEVFFVLPSANYEVLLSVNDNLAFTFGFGLVVFDPVLPMIDAGIVMGNGKNNFEVGIKFIPLENDVLSLLKLGYRYVSKKNYLIKGGVTMIVEDFFPIPSVTFGYMF